MKTPPCARRRTAGFTLIEILVVLLLMGLLLTFLLPSFLKAIQRQKLLGTAQQTAILLRMARLQAIKTATNAVVQIDTTKGTVTAFVDPNNNQTLDASETMLRRVDLPKGVTFMAVDGFTTPPTPAVAIFGSNGTMPPVDAVGTGKNGAFRFQNTAGDQLEARVLSATSGRVVIRKNDGSGNWIQNGQGVWKWN